MRYCAFFGTLTVAELATTLPQARGWYVYARRALGEYAGFTIGWINWVSTRNLPRSMIGAVLVIIALYLLVNLALLHVLPLSQLAASQLAAADAAQVMFGAQGGEMITALSFLSLLSVTNEGFMQTPRILYGMSRDECCRLFFSLE